MSTRTDAVVDQLRALAQNLRRSDAMVLQSAIELIREMEDRLSDYEDDITDWQNSVMTQMGRTGKEGR